MDSQIITDIDNLKIRYPYDTNIYKVEKISSEDLFQNQIETFIKDYKDYIQNVKIVDCKCYYDDNKILEILDNGEMKCLNLKKLKYITYDNNIKLELYNERIININSFHYKQHYEKIYKMKKIIFNDINDNIIEFNVIVDDNDTRTIKKKIFSINIIMLSSNNSNNISKIIKLLIKNE